MKKLFLFFTLLAGIAVMTGCKKDQDVVTLQAAIDQDTKAYFGNTVRTLPYWNAGDKVKVNGTVKTLTLPNNPTTFASIEGVDESNYYAAIFPADAAETMYTPDEEDGTTHAVVYFRPDQVYKEVTVEEDGEDVTLQQVDMIMGAVANNTTKTLIFKNLCSILRLEITNNFRDANNQPCTVNVSRVTVEATGAYVAGSLDATLYSDGNDPNVDSETPSAGAKNVLSLYPENNSGYIKNLAPGATATIDVVVPPFNASSLNIELELFDGNDNMIGNSDAIINDPPALDINEIVTIALNTDHEVEVADYAYIESGPDFYDHMRELLTELAPSGGKINSIQFNTVESNDRPTTSAHGTIASSIKNVKAAHSAFNIWAYLVHTWGSYYTLEVDCQVPLIYADKDCSYMFADLPDLETMNWTNTATSGFQTEDVVDMSYMFRGSKKLNSIQGANFNTTNVRTMAHMFDGCYSFQDDASLNISGFITHNLQDMEAMFKGCYGISSLNISNFITKRVYNMSELFSGCIKLKTIHIDRFDMSSVTNKDHMCQNLGTFGQETIKIYCTDPTWTAIQTGTDLSSNTQHLQPTVSK